MFDRFSKEKSDFLKKKDKSRKGSVDVDIAELVSCINSEEDYYTTSSCAGRIVLLEMKSRKKNECNWLISKHSKITYNEIKTTLENYRNNKIKNKKIKNDELIGETSDVVIGASRAQDIANKVSGFGKPNKQKFQIWLRQEPLILHVACRNIESARKLLDTARGVFKHSGIIGITDKKITVEIIGNERLETIVADNNFVADENYLKELVKYANKNFAENKKKIEKFQKLLKFF